MYGLPTCSSPALFITFIKSAKNPLKKRLFFIYSLIYRLPSAQLCSQSQPRGLAPARWQPNSHCCRVRAKTGSLTQTLLPTLRGVIIHSKIMGQLKEISLLRNRGSRGSANGAYCSPGSTFRLQAGKKSVCVCVCVVCVPESCLGGQEEQQECVMLHSAGTQLGHYLTHLPNTPTCTHTHTLFCSSVTTVPSHCEVNCGFVCVCSVCVCVCVCVCR